MGKQLFIAEKPSVAQEFARALKIRGGRQGGYIETDQYVVTWCVGHLVTMSYPEAYDPKYKKWSLATLPFLPGEFKYEIIPSVKKQYGIVKKLLTRDDVDVIYVCTDSGREGEYIYRLVEMKAGGKVRRKLRKRVWIDSFTEEEVLRGIREAKDEAEYDSVSDAAYLRAIEDYLMGINFSRLLTLKYGNSIASYQQERYAVISVGRVMTCVLGMVVQREREIRAFVKKPFYRLVGNFSGIEGEWKAVKGSAYDQSPLLYKENGFHNKEDALALRDALLAVNPREGIVTSLTTKTEKKAPPLLYNLAELQNDCASAFKLSPDQTLKIAQELYEKKLTTYPRTDARVLSGAVAKQIRGNIQGLTHYEDVKNFAKEILEQGSYQRIPRTKYTNDKAITDHYAIIPTGSGLNALSSLHPTTRNVYKMIVLRFLSIFYPPAEYQKTNIVVSVEKEQFFANDRRLLKEGYLKVTGRGKEKDKKQRKDPSTLNKGDHLPITSIEVKEGETVPPKRYTSGSMILAMENAGRLIEDESLREQIKGSGIGTSATRAEILNKLVKIGYLNLNKKTQIITPELQGEMVYDVVNQSIRPLLNPELTASWEKGLTQVADGSITRSEYMEKLEGFIQRRCNAVMQVSNAEAMRPFFDEAAKYYKSVTVPTKHRRKTGARKTGERKRYGTTGTSKN